MTVPAVLSSTARRAVLWALAALLILAGCPEGGAPPLPGAPESAPEAVSLPPEASAGWYAEVQARIAASQYAPQREGEGFRLVNRAHDLLAQVGPAGLRVRPRSGGDEVTLELAAWGREGALAPAEPGEPAEGACAAGGAVDTQGQCVRRVEADRGGLTEWWENGVKGLEQGFTVPSAPAGEGPLVLELAVEGAAVEVEAGGTAARLVPAAGGAYRYSGLAAWDEDGTALPARMEAIPGGLRLVVDDAGAWGIITVDPLLTASAWTGESDQASAYFGASVSGAGDVNGDGYGDVIVGAVYYDNGSTDEGRAYVYHGSASGLSTTAAWTGEPDQAYAYYGVSVSGAGDVNGDGYGDVIVGAVAYDNGSTDEGRAYVYYGSASGLSTAADWTGESDQEYAFYGWAVSSAGDVNGDGYGDVLVGAVYYSNGSLYEGRAYVYHGSASGLSTTAAWTGESDQLDGQYGSALSEVGDVNGDGYGDVIISAPYYSNGSTDEGRAYVYHGSASGLSTTAAWTAEPDQAKAYYGWSVSGAGDVNGDGYADVIVGAPDYDNGSTNEGKVWVYHGSASGLSTSAAWTTEPDQASASYGSGVSGAGDVNGDGYGDVLVGARYYDNGSSNEGRGFVYYGSSSGLSTSAAWTGEPDQANAEYGYAVSGAGDVNGDGYADIIVSSPYYDNGSTDEGRAYLYHGSGGGLATTAGWTGESNQAGASYGTSASSAGDVNGDGYGDVIVGAMYYDNGSTDEGRAYVYHGSASGLSTTAAWTGESDQASAYYAYAVSSAGDVNGDGYGDVIVGAMYYDNGSTDEGKAWLYHGSASGLSASAAWTGEPDQASAYYGVSVSGAGDVNGDGYGDVLVGAYQYDNGSTNEGKAWLYHGSASGLSASAAWTGEPDQASAYYGISVSGAGDVNGDGYVDVIVGAYGYNNGSYSEGKAWLYHGSASGLSTSAAWTTEPDQEGAYYGYTVSGAGDVNGDGYADVLVGAPYYDNGSSNEGKAWVYHGSASGLSTTAAWATESNQADAEYGCAISEAGDVNGDGYGDVLVGTYGYDNGSSNEGRAYVYYGSASGLSTTAGWTAEPDQAGAYYGSGLGGAGDVNGDGYADIIVGAYYYDNGSSNEGGAFLYYGNGADGTGLGLSRAAQARQPGTSTPLSPGLVSTAEDGFDVAVLKARGPWGRSRVAVQVEVEPLGVAFDGADLVASSDWTSSGLAGISAQVALSGLDSGEGYHWRARVLADPAQGADQGWGPWLYGGQPGEAQGGHVFTQGALVYADADGDGYGDDASSQRARGGIPAGYVENAEDCDDASAAISPAAAEVCDEADTDEDCDGSAEDADASATGFSTFYEDNDSDGYGSAAASFCDQPSGYVDNAEDCDDGDSAISPAAAEVCDEADTDEDCDGTADDSDGSATGQSTFYADEDGDGYGSTAATSLCDQPSGYVDNAEDCDDTRAAIHPDAAEVCDTSNADEDCDGMADDDDASATGKGTFYLDSDGDGYGSTAATSLCDQPSGYVDNAEDCDDASAAISPAAAEVCDEADTDEDCDGTADDSDGSATGQSTFYADEDGDGYGSAAASFCDQPSGYVDNDEDCDDADGSAYPGGVEVAGDGIDGDCDADERCFADADNDGYRLETTIASADLDCADSGEAAADAPTGDCDDTDDAFHPGAAEDDCTDPSDYNCDGSSAYADADEDGFAACEECDDGNAGVNPDALELIGDEVDQDCDGTELCYVEADDDGFRVESAPTIASDDADCTDSGEGLAGEPTGDCDDANSGINPGAAEILGDEIDQDCDGDETCYLDADSDGYHAGVALDSADADCGDLFEAAEADPSGDCDDEDAAFHPGADEDDCADPSDYNCDGSVGYADADSDGFAACQECDDGDGAVNPDAAEVCNGYDDDCDGTTDGPASADASDWYPDADGDGYTAEGDPLADCAAPDGYTAPSDEPDCDDDDAGAYPGASEAAGDGIDQDCDGQDLAGEDTGGPDDTGGPNDTAADTGEGGETPKDEGCGGCASSGSPAPLAALALAVLALARRGARAASSPRSGGSLC